MRTSLATEERLEIIRWLYLEPNGINLISQMTGLKYRQITMLAKKYLGLSRRGMVAEKRKDQPVATAEDPNTPENIQMLKTKRCKGINGKPCTGMIRMDRTDGLDCWLAICHYGHTFSFFWPFKH